MASVRQASVSGLGFTRRSISSPLAMAFVVFLSLRLATAEEPARAPMHPADAFQIRLRSGKKVDVRQLMQVDQKSYDTRLRRQEASGQFTRINHTNGNPYLFVSRRGTKLFGLLAGRYVGGQPMICMTYVVGKRHGSLLCWDDGGRPLVYEQYDNGVRDGLRCIFKSCGEDCKEGHLWLAEEWLDGRRVATHLRTAEGQESSAGALNAQNVDYVTAKSALSDFEGTLTKNEKQLKMSVVQLYEYEKRLARARAIAAMIASQQRAFGSSAPVSYGSMPVCRTGGG